LGLEPVEELGEGAPELARAGASPFRLCAEDVCGAQVIRRGDPWPSVFIGGCPSVLPLQSRGIHGPRLKIEQSGRVSGRRCSKDPQSAPEEGRREGGRQGKSRYRFSVRLVVFVGIAAPAS
jgi:hypothetical protein